MASEVDTLAAEFPGSKAVSAAFARADWLPTNADSFDVAANCHCCSCRGSVQALRVLADALACCACAQRIHRLPWHPAAEGNAQHNAWTTPDSSTCVVVWMNDRVVAHISGRVVGRVRGPEAAAPLICLPRGSVALRGSQWAKA